MKKSVEARFCTVSSGPMPISINAPIPSLWAYAIKVCNQLKHNGDYKRFHKFWENRFNIKFTAFSNSELLATARQWETCLIAYIYVVTLCFGSFRALSTDDEISCTFSFAFLFIVVFAESEFCCVIDVINFNRITKYNTNASGLLLSESECYAWPLRR